MTTDRPSAPGFDRAMWVITGIAALAIVGSILGALWGGLTILTLFKVLVTATLAWLVAGVVAHLVCSRRRA